MTNGADQTESERFSHLNNECSPAKYGLGSDRIEEDELPGARTIRFNSDVIHQGRVSGSEVGAHCDDHCKIDVCGQPYMMISIRTL